MRKLLKITLTLFLIIILVLGFALPLNPAGNWYQQFFPNLGGRQINDIFFTDSINGYAITSSVSNTSYILKTTNKGDNWSIIYTDSDTNIFSCLFFLNQSTGYLGGYISTGFSFHILKTTNGGNNWVTVSTPVFTDQTDIHVLNEDTIWFVMDEGTSGGVFRTTNAGINWVRTNLQFSGGNPQKIYMYNRNIGFASSSPAGAYYRTTNSGVNWNRITGIDGFIDMVFVDSLTGWKTNGMMKKTTDGGLSWLQQAMPSGGIISGSGVIRLSLLNRDTIWATGGDVQYPNLQNRGIIFRTTNGGNNWLFQIPDTSYHVLTGYAYIQFINSKIGWAYTLGFLGGIHTINGGDTTWLTGITQLSSEVPKEFNLFQNYPNPFNPVTNIKYDVRSQTSNIKLAVFDVTGRHVIDLVNQKQTAGTYMVDFSGAGIASGVYFYSLAVDGTRVATKKMILLK